MVQPFCSKSADTWRWNVNLKFKGQLKSRHLFSTSNFNQSVPAPTEKFRNLAQVAGNDERLTGIRNRKWISAQSLTSGTTFLLPNHRQGGKSWPWRKPPFSRILWKWAQPLHHLLLVLRGRTQPCLGQPLLLRQLLLRAVSNLAPIESHQSLASTPSSTGERFWEQHLGSS